MNSHYFWHMARLGSLVIERLWVWLRIGLLSNHKFENLDKVLKKTKYSCKAGHNTLMAYYSQTERIDMDNKTGLILFV